MLLGLGESVTESEMAILTVMASSIGGALGARNAQADAWRGFVIIAASTVATLLLFSLLDVSNNALSLLCNFVLAGVIGGALKLSGRQIGVVVIGAILLGVIAVVVVGFLAKP